MYFAIADEHYDHEAIIRYQGRPFRDIHDMREYMISNHNEVVGPKDTTIHAGDFFWGKRYKDAQRIIERLNGSHIFLEGDHDKWMRGPREQIWRGMVGKHYLVICHYPIFRWPRSHYNSWHVYGHTHREVDLPGKTHCISVENTDYYPISFEEIEDIMSSRGDNPNLVPKEKRRR